MLSKYKPWNEKPVMWTKIGNQTKVPFYDRYKLIHNQIVCSLVLKCGFVSYTKDIWYFRNLLAAAMRQNVTDHFVWVASDGWGQQELPVRGNDEAAEGALTIGTIHLTDLGSRPLTGNNFSIAYAFWKNWQGRMPTPLSPSPPPPPAKNPGSPLK